MRQALRAVLESDATAPSWNRLAELIQAGDREIERLAAAVALHTGATTTVPCLVSWIGRTGPGDLRFAVEQASRPLPVEFGSAVSAVLVRTEPETDRVAADLAKRLERETAEAMLLSMIQTLPAGSPGMLAALESLSSVAGPASTAALASFSAHRHGSTALAARQAADSLRTRLLSSARLEECLTLDRTVRTWLPGDVRAVLKEAQLVGIYQEDPEAAFRLLDRLLERHALTEPGDAALPAVEALLARAAILFFNGRPGADGTLSVALDRLGTPPAHAAQAATMRSRLHLVGAVMAVTRGDPEPVIADHLAAALRHAPYDREYSVFDQAMYGEFGPLTLLDRLRRTDRVAAQLAFLAALEEALAAPGNGPTLGIPALDSSEQPLPGSNEAVGRSEQVKSWIPWWRQVALFNAGHLDEALRVGRRVAESLRQTDVWENRRLAGQVSLELGRIHLRSHRPELARDDFRAAIGIFLEIDLATAEHDVTLRAGRFRAGAPPYRRPYRALLAEAHLGLADACLLQIQPALALAEAREAVRLHPQGDHGLLVLARFLAGGEDPERAARVFESLPRQADLLLELGRLALALGRRDEAQALFEQHLLWNALTPEREAVERDWWRTWSG